MGESLAFGTQGHDYNLGDEMVEDVGAYPNSSIPLYVSSNREMDVDAEVSGHDVMVFKPRYIDSAFRIFCVA
jgi:hypothetical protein